LRKTKKFYDSLPFSGVFGGGVGGSYEAKLQKEDGYCLKIHV